MTKKNDRVRMSLDDLGDVITPEEYAKAAGVHPNTVRAHCGNGTIPCRRSGRKWLIPKTALTETRERIAADDAEALCESIRRLVAEGVNLTIEIRSSDGR